MAIAVRNRSPVTIDALHPPAPPDDGQLEREDG
jgi:hypothetical protein